MGIFNGVTEISYLRPCLIKTHANQPTKVNLFDPFLIFSCYYGTKNNLGDIKQKNKYINKKYNCSIKSLK